MISNMCHWVRAHLLVMSVTISEICKIHVWYRVSFTSKHQNWAFGVSMHHRGKIASSASLVEIWNKWRNKHHHNLLWVETSMASARLWCHPCHKDCLLLIIIIIIIIVVIIISIIIMICGLASEWCLCHRYHKGCLSHQPCPREQNSIIIAQGCRISIFSHSRATKPNSTPNKSA